MAGEREGGSLRPPTGSKSYVRTFRQYLLERLGEGGQRAWDTLIDISDGKPWIPILKDPRTGMEMQGPLQVPSAGDRRAAAERILDGLHGKPVPETDIMEAEKASTELEAVKALSDDELDRRVRAIYAGREASRLPTTSAQVVEPAVLEDDDHEFGDGEDE